MNATRKFVFAVMMCCGFSNVVRAAPPITAAAFAPDGSAVVVGSQSGIEVRSWPDLKSERRLTTQLEHVHDVSFSPSGDTLAAAGGAPAESGCVELFRWPSGEPLARHKLADDVIFRVAWRPNGEAFSIAAADRSVVLLGRDGGILQRFAGHSRGVTAVAFLPAGDRLISGGLDQSLRLWNAANGELLRTFDNHTSAVNDVAVRPKHETAPPLIATAGADRTVRFWQPTIGRLVRFARLPSEPLAVAWTPDGRTALAVCRDGQLCGIDPDSAEIIWKKPVLAGWAYTLAISPDGHYALVGGEAGELQALRLPNRN